MKFKYLVALLAVFIFIASASAADMDYFAQDTAVEISGFEFMIPEGFGAYEDGDVNVTEDGFNQTTRFFANDDGEVLMATVYSGDDVNQDLETYKNVADNPKKMKINNEDGYHMEKDGYQFFIYLKDGCVILMQAPDDSYFEGMMPK